MNSIPLSEFSGVRGSGHARLYIKASDSGAQTVVSEKLGSRILTRLGKLPLLRNTESVQERRNAAAREDYYTRRMFKESLKQVYGDSFSQQAIQDIAGKKLTQREVRKIINNAEKMKVDGGKEEPKVLSCKAGEFTKVDYDTSLKELDLFARKANEITGRELKNIETTDKGCLRSLMMAAQRVAQFTDNPDITKAIQTLLNVHIGGIPFSQFGANAMDGRAVQWVKNASKKELNYAADMMRKIASDFEKLLQNIKSGRDKINAPSLGMARFDGIRVNPQTQVVLSDGTPLPVNTLTYGRKPVALAGSFPTENGMEKYLQMLVEKNCTCLAVLTSPGQMTEKGLPSYFAGNHKYGEVDVSSEKVSGPGMTNVYRLTLRYQGKAHTLHVIHALNWPDHGALPRTDDLRQLAQLVNQYQSGSPEASVPMIHCLGGVGRTGTLAAATLLLKAPNIELDRVVDEFRDARNERMLEDDVQREQLKALQQELTSSR
ncbi:protein-tyrosine phosphatase family protein [Escherichia coli]|uniref:protein-tyrosine phosphatase family protein n=1 Tax=Escherichia coli TaxID=562 RepID=UPI000ABCDBE8|nr:protein-tyrosine phosphatase family protein [Escherichia coli]